MTLSPCFNSASRTALPKACWPWTTIRIQWPTNTYSVVPAECSEGRNPYPSTGVMGPRLRGGDSFLRRLFLLLRRAESAGVFDVGDLGRLEAEHVGKDLVGVLAEQ